MDNPTTIEIPDFLVSKIHWGKAGGDYLKYLRKEKKLTQSDLAQKIGISRQMLNQWENADKHPDISIEFLHKICEILNISLKDFIDNYDSVVFYKK